MRMYSLRGKEMKVRGGAWEEGQGEGAEGKLFRRGN